MTAVLESLSLHDAIPLFKQETLAGKEKETRDAIFSFVAGKTDAIPGLVLGSMEVKSVSPHLH